MVNDVESIQPPFYPSRLLYLGREGGVIKLVVTATQRPTSPYLTLSVGIVLKVKGLQASPLHFLLQPPILSILAFLLFRGSFISCLLHLICFLLFLGDRIAESNRKATAYSLWQSMVEAYSKCSLTRSEDKFVTLSGLAKSIRDVTGDEYSAGMWRRTMAFDLPWWRDTESRNFYPWRITPYRAPSWSCASLEGEINFPSGANHTEFITVVGANLSYVSDEDVTAGGLLEGSSIQIEGQLNTIVLHGSLKTRLVRL